MVFRGRTPSSPRSFERRYGIPYQREWHARMNNYSPFSYGKPRYGRKPVRFVSIGHQRYYEDEVHDREAFRQYMRRLAPSPPMGIIRPRPMRRRRTQWRATDRPFPIVHSMPKVANAAYREGLKRLAALPGGLNPAEVQEVIEASALALQLQNNKERVLQEEDITLTPAQRKRMEQSKRLAQLRLAEAENRMRNIEKARGLNLSSIPAAEILTDNQKQEVSEAIAACIRDDANPGDAATDAAEPPAKKQGPTVPLDASGRVSSTFVAMNF